MNLCRYLVACLPKLQKMPLRTWTAFSIFFLRRTVLYGSYHHMLLEGNMHAESVIILFPPIHLEQLQLYSGSFSYSSTDLMNLIPTIRTTMRDRGTSEKKSIIQDVARWCNNQWEIPTNRERYTREVPKRQEQLNKRESQTQYLTRFDNLPTSSGQGREILLIQQSITGYNSWGALPLYL